MIKQCVVCGGDFEARGPQKSCSQKCAKKRSRERMNRWYRDQYATDPIFNEFNRTRQRNRMCLLRSDPRYVDHKRCYDRERLAKARLAVRVLSGITDENKVTKRRRDSEKQQEYVRRYRDKNLEKYRDSNRKSDAKRRIKRAAALEFIRELGVEL